VHALQHAERVKNVPSTVSENVAIARDSSTPKESAPVLHDDRVDVGRRGEPRQQRAFSTGPSPEAAQPSTW